MAHRILQIPLPFIVIRQDAMRPLIRGIAFEGLLDPIDAVFFPVDLQEEFADFQVDILSCRWRIGRILEEFVNPIDDFPLRHAR